MTDPTDRTDDSPIEHRLRQLLAEEAEGVRATEPPCTDIVQVARTARARRRAVLGASLAVLVAVPGAAVAGAAVFGSGPDADHHAAAPATESDAGTGDPGAPAPPDDSDDSSDADDGDGGQADSDGADHQGTARLPEHPERQLLDGVSGEEARSIAEDCLAFHHKSQEESAAFGMEIGTMPEFQPEDLTILYAWRAQGGVNVDMAYQTRVLVVATDPPEGAVLELICAADEDGATGLQSAAGSVEGLGGDQHVDTSWAARYASPGEGVEVSDDRPLRWASFGRVSDAVDRVTVEHAGQSQEALISGGYYLSTGNMETATRQRPVITAYDADGDLLFDSTTLPGW
ncbi:hypothetical protein [Streptomyces otsuchiensis]|uniref:hypothetical protein n=1 Tax=Streptomyces otsuchiensis TaxID=2681388 RepID=UPI00102F9F3B|nr:hypothetical protein [Streptomyces otsuchiensis]